MDETGNTVPGPDDQDLAEFFAGWTDEQIDDFRRFGLPAELNHSRVHEASGEPLGQRRKFIHESGQVTEVTVLTSTQDGDGFVARQVVTDGTLVFEVDTRDLVPGTL